jgi:hypothetical protein
MIILISSAVSLLALVISAITAWLTLFRRGTVKMTQPTVIYFGPDRARPGEHSAPPKVFLRTLLFSTSKRGRVIESMHASLSRNETMQNFNVWVHGDEKLVRGSGLFVGESGISANHHFLTPKDGSHFRFLIGRYRLQVFAKLLGDKGQSLLFNQELEITGDIAAQLERPLVGLYFDWGPDAVRYIPHIEERPDVADLGNLIEALQATKQR